MTEPTDFSQVVDPVVETDTGNGPDGGDSGGSGGHPAWQEVLNYLPEGYHEKVKQTLGDMDRRAQERFEQVHSEYAPYKQYKDAGITQQHLDAAMNLYNLVDTEPERLYRQLGEFYKFDQQPVENAPQGQGQQPGNGPTEFDLDGQQQQFTLPPEIAQRLDQFEQWQGNIDAAVQAEANRQVQQQANDEVDAAANAVAQKYADHGLDMQYVATVAFQMMQNNPDATAEQLFEAGAQNYIQARQRMMGARPGNTAPQVMPTGGGMPQVAKNPVDMTPQEKRAAALQMLGTLQDN